MNDMLFKQQPHGDEAGLGFSGRGAAQIEDGIALRLRILLRGYLGSATGTCRL